MSETVETQTENVVVGKVTQESLETPVEEAQAQAQGEQAQGEQAQGEQAQGEQVQEKAQAPNVRPKVNLLEVDITDENAALRILVGFIGVAQQRGAFAINESAKIYECIKLFHKPAATDN